MNNSELNIVTGAFGYTGKYITRQLLSMGKTVRTITGHPNRDNPFGGQVAAFPFNFDNPSELVDSLRGATTLYNTYWVRFSHKDVTHEKAVENTAVLIESAKVAGVRRFVHVSIANPSEHSPLPYYKGKALIEKAIVQSGLSYAIIRPTVIFGAEDILINNIAWLIRKFPIFVIPGSGEYQLQPIFVEDVAEITVNLGQGNNNVIADAVGPDIFTFNELIQLIANKIHSRGRVVHLRPELAYFLSKLVGFMVKDVTLTRDEIEGLMANLLVSGNPPKGKTRLSDWLTQNAYTVGNRYASELKRHY